MNAPYVQLLQKKITFSDCRFCASPDARADAQRCRANRCGLS